MQPTLVNVMESVDLGRPPEVDRKAAELALWQHLSAVGGETNSFTWVADLEEGFERARQATESNAFWAPSTSRSRFSLWNPDAPVSFPDRMLPRRDDSLGRPVFAAVRATLGRRWHVHRTTRTYRRWRLSYASVPEPVNVHRLGYAAIDEEYLVAAGRPTREQFEQPEKGEHWLRTAGRDARFAEAVRTYESARYRLPSLEPLVRAWAAGVYGFWVIDYARFRQRHCIVVPRPAFHRSYGVLDRDDGPAVEWPDGVSYWFWEGIHVPKRAATMKSERARLQVLIRTRNQELRRMLLERLGYERFLELAGAGLVQQDDYGKLWHTDIKLGGEPVRTVEVVNATAEPDGSHRRYFLRVPPVTRTAREAVAWTFGYDTASDYEVRVQT